LNARIVFIDESGFLMAPFVRRTWAPRGQTPILKQRGQMHTKVSAIAAISISPKGRNKHLYFRLHPLQSINSALIGEFLHQLRHQIRQAIIIVWDRLRAHRSGRIQRLAAAATKPLHIEFLPPYSPWLNPVEYLWSFLKTNPLANACDYEIDQLTRRVRRSTRKVKSDKVLLNGFVKHCGLPL
jgi:transposase